MNTIPFRISMAIWSGSIRGTPSVSFIMLLIARNQFKEGCASEFLGRLPGSIVQFWVLLPAGDPVGVVSGFFGDRNLDRRRVW